MVGFTSRMTLLFLLLLGSGFAWIIYSSIDDVRRQYREATEEPLVDLAALLAGTVETESQDGVLRYSMLSAALQRAQANPLEAKIYGFTKTRVDIRSYLTDARGRVVFDSAGIAEVGADYSEWNDVARALRGEYGSRTSRDDPTAKGSVLYVALPVRVANQIVGVLTVAKPTANANFLIWSAKRDLRSFLFLVFLTLGSIAALRVPFVTRPLRQLTNYARNVRDGKNAKLPRLRVPELKTLGSALEEMRTALDGRRYVERYVQTLTHELKSPLTAIQAATEILQENPPEPDRLRFLTSIARENERMRQLVDRLLALSHLQTRNQLEAENQLPALGLVEQAVESVSGRAEARRVHVRTDISPAHLVSGEEFWLVEALANILANAMDFAPEGSEITVTSSADASLTTLRVENNGPSIPEWALPKVFDPFFSLPRPDTEQRSTGMGLALVREIVELHSGEVLISNREEGGVLVTLILPR